MTAYDEKDDLVMIVDFDHSKLSGNLLILQDSIVAMKGFIKKRDLKALNSVKMEIYVY